jgi:hypothetical protein
MSLGIRKVAKALREVKMSQKPQKRKKNSKTQKHMLLFDDCTFSIFPLSFLGKCNFLPLC